MSPAPSQLIQHLDVMANPRVIRHYRGRLWRRKHPPVGGADQHRAQPRAARKIAEERMRYWAAPSGLEPRIDPPRLCAQLAWLGVAFGRLTSKIHAVVDTSGLPVWLALTAGL